MDRFAFRFLIVFTAFGIFGMGFAIYQLVWGINKKSRELWCGKPFPVFYEEGERATYIKTGETIRVVVKFRLVGTSDCEKERYSHYTINFNDGVRLDVDSVYLEKINKGNAS